MDAERTKKEDSWIDLVRFAVICIIVVIPFRIFIAQPYIVEGSSMDPTFKNGDYLIVDQISYNFTEPERGEVIILKFPQDTSRFLIKRVIGLPNETVIGRNGRIFIKKDGIESSLEEDYIKYEKADNFEFKLSEGEYFVMGDNRAGSSDSRIWGALPAEDVVGRAILRLFPVNAIDILPGE